MAGRLMSGGRGGLMSGGRGGNDVWRAGGLVSGWLGD